MNFTTETSIPDTKDQSETLSNLLEIEGLLEDGELTADEWCTLPLDTIEPVIGTRDNCIVRPLTKNIILAPEKAFKTTFTLRLMLGLSNGTCTFPELPIFRPATVLYVHGELSPPEIQVRTRAAKADLHGSNFYQAWNCKANLCSDDGQAVLTGILDKHKHQDHCPQVLVLDPWQEFIAEFDENNSKEISGAQKFIQRLIREYQLTVFIVAHKGKDRQRGMRGTSSMGGWRDTLFTIDRKGQGKQIRVTVEPRWASPVPPFSLVFRDGTVVDTGTGIHAFAPQAMKIRDYLARNSGQSTKKQLATVLQIENTDSLKRALRRAAQDGAIKINGDIVSLPDTDGTSTCE